MSLKRSNRSFSNNSLNNTWQENKKIPKRSASLKLSPAMLQKNMRECLKLEGLEEFVECNSFQRLIYPSINNDKCVSTCAALYPDSFSESSQNIGRDKKYFFNRKVKAVETVEYDVDTCPLSKQSGDYIPKPDVDGLLPRRDEIGCQSQFEKPIARRSFFARSAEDLKCIIKHSKRKTSKNGPLEIPGRLDSSPFHSLNNLPDTNSEQSMGTESSRNIKSILKNNFDRQHDSINLRKKVRFDLGPQSAIPKVFRDLYLPLQSSDYSKNEFQCSNENLQIPEKDVTPHQGTENQIAKCVMTPVILDTFENQPMVDDFSTKKTNVAEEELITLIKNNVTGDLEGSNPSGNSNCTQKLCKNNSFQTNDGAPLSYKNVVTKNGINKSCLQRFQCIVENTPKHLPVLKTKESETRSTRRIQKQTLKKVSDSPKAGEFPALKKFQVRKINSGIQKESDQVVPSNHQTSYDKDTESNLFQLGLEKVLNCPKTQLLNYLKSLSLAISLRDDSKALNKAMLQGLLRHLKKGKRGININVPGSHHNHRNDNRLSQGARLTKLNSMSDLSEGALESNLESSTLGSSTCSIRTSSVTSISSLVSSNPSVEKKLGEANVKSLNHLHRCLEETFHNDIEIAGCKTEFKNYSSSSSDSKNCKESLLNNTLQKLTSVLEELNVKVDKLTSSEEQKPNASSFQADSRKRNRYYEDISAHEINDNTSCASLRGQNIDSNVDENGNSLNALINNFEPSNIGEKPQIRNNLLKHNALTLHHGRMGISQSSQVHNEIVIRLTDESVAFKKEINMTFQLLPHPQAMPKVLDEDSMENGGFLQNSFQDSVDFIGNRLPRQPEPSSISNKDVQSILKEINDKINPVKLNGPNMYEPVKIEHRVKSRKSSTSFKEISQTLQKSFNGFISTAYKRLHPVVETKFKFKQRVSKSKARSSSTKVSSDDDTSFIGALKHLLPFCKPSDLSDDDQQGGYYLSTTCNQKGIQTDKDDTGSSNMSLDWPDLKRTKYPNGKVYYGRLKRIPEPKLCYSSSSSRIPSVVCSHEYCSCSSGMWSPSVECSHECCSQAFKKTVYRKSMSHKFTFSDSDLQRRVMTSCEHVSLEEKHTVTL